MSWQIPVTTPATRESWKEAGISCSAKPPAWACGAPSAFRRYRSCGDCNAYAEQTELTSGDAAITMKGADGLVQLAIWQADGYTYAVSVENGLTADAMAELVAQVR